MTTPEQMLIRRRLNEGSHDKPIPVIAESKDPWVKNFVRRLAILIRDIGCGKPS
jgi:hypothetical protein